jgi:hypothetical protein
VRQGEPEAGSSKSIKGTNVLGFIFIEFNLGHLLWEELGLRL